MMDCIGPFTPEDADLLAYADSVASPAVLEHLSACSACNVRAYELDREQRRFQALLYRTGCPPILQLGEYYLDLLGEQPKSDVALHLTACPACRSELEDLSGFIASLRRPVATAAENLIGSLRTLRARSSVDPLMGLYGQMAPALRGPGDERTPLVYTAEDVLVTVDSWAERLGQPGRVVAGLVVGPADFANAEATINAGEVSNTCPINELGNFLFSDVSPGVHHLTLRLPATGLQIEVDDLTVK